MKLAKWEDRGYYSLQMAIEKSQRQLHRLSRRAEQALRQPVANVLADASAAMGFPDLTNPETVVGLASSGTLPQVDILYNKILRVTINCGTS